MKRPEQVQIEFLTKNTNASEIKAYNTLKECGYDLIKAYKKLRNYE